MSRIASSRIRVLLVGAFFIAACDKGATGTENVKGNFTLGSPNSAVTVAQGGGGLVTILVPRSDSNASTVSLAISGGPTGLSAGAVSTTGNAVSLTLAATNAAAAGVYDVTVTGSAAGLQDQTTHLTVTVIAP